MFKDSVFRWSVNTKQWLKASAIRAVKTFAQTAVSLITVGQMVTELNWIQIVGVSATSAVISILTSIGGIPEVKAYEVKDSYADYAKK